MTRMRLTHTQDIKLIIIQNFIDYYTSDEKERESMYEVAFEYVKDDHVDEIESAFNVSKFSNKPTF
jgi:hypothetical protein